MKTFLEICGDAWGRTGLSGSGPTSVTTATGLEKSMVGYVRQALIEIHQYRSDWPWLFKEFSFTTSPDKYRYPVVELNLTDQEKWDFSGASIYKTADGKSSEMFIGSTTYDTYWSFLRIGEQLTTQPDRLFSDPIDNTLCVYPVPNTEYTITLRYYRAPQVLAADGDIPILPTNTSWQEIIKWKALYLYAFEEGDGPLLEEAEDEYDRMIGALDNRYGQNITISASPIA